MYAVDAFEQAVEILDLRGGRAVVFRKYCDGIRVLVVAYTDIVICAVIPAVFMRRLSVSRDTRDELRLIAVYERILHQSGILMPALRVLIYLLHYAAAVACAHSTRT